VFFFFLPQYPASVERAGPQSDVINLSFMMQEMRKGLPGSKFVSIATPAGFWFLRGFDILNIATAVDFVNLMSYDYVRCLLLSFG
jgi:chitinase